MIEVTSYGPAFLFFFLPILGAIALTFLGSKILARRIGRARLPSASGIATFVLANAAFLLLNVSVEISPLGADVTWVDLWVFGFAPVSVICAIVMTKAVDHLHENDREEV